MQSSHLARISCLSSRCPSGSRVKGSSGGGVGSQIHSTNGFFDFQNSCRRSPMRLAVHLWNMARIRKQMKKSIKSSSAKSPETQGHSLPEGLTEGSMKAGGLEPAKTGLRDRISPICTLSQNGYGAWRCSLQKSKAHCGCWLNVKDKQQCNYGFDAGQA